MSSVTVTVNGRTYKIACDDGQEKHLLGLAAHVNEHVEKLKSGVGQVGDTRLLLMAAIMIADELAESRRRIDAIDAELQRLKGARDTAAGQFQAAQDAVARTLHAAAQRVEDMTAMLDGNRR